MPGATISPPPPLDPSKSPIENALELTPLLVLGPDIFTNTRPLWHPPGARGIYGGAIIAQSLSAATLTLPSQTSQSPTKPPEAAFFPHSLHAYFVLSGQPAQPVFYHVERVRDGRTFCTRTVQARQGGKPILTATCSFVRERSAGERNLEHGVKMLVEAKAELEARLREDENEDGKEEMGREQAERNGVQSKGPFRIERFGIRDINHGRTKIEERIPRQWFKALGPQRNASSSTTTPSLATQFAALAYISDTWFVGTIPRVHGLFGEVYSRPHPSSPPVKNMAPPLPASTFLARNDNISGGSSSSSITDKTTLNNQKENIITSSTPAPRLGMMLSLDHTIYFHNPHATRIIDEWMYSEMSSPWSGDGRGLVTQRIWNQEGVLVASCFQEGVVRLKRDTSASTNTNTDIPPSSSKL